MKRLCPALCIGLLTSAQAQQVVQEAVQKAETVVVSATRIEASAFDVPASIDRIDGTALREGRLQVNLSESLTAVPGLMAQNRQNYAQDLQISVRGFGARSTFGVRGVRFYVDGIPATMPDGQGQTSNIELGSVGRIEVLRGPYSALYGNSSGGVVQVFSEEVGTATQASTSLALGSHHTGRIGLKLSGPFAQDSANYLVSAGHFETDGERDHSVARRDLANAKVVFKLDDASTLSLIANSVSLPRADDPLGLSRAQYDAAPKSVDASALQFNTRKTLRQTQAGLIYEHRFNEASSLRVLAYGGARATTQFQAIPLASQTPATSPGGVIDLARKYSGTDVRWTMQQDFGAQHISLVLGVNTDVLDETRRGYQNFIGTGSAQQLGVQGALRRDETNRVTDFDPYAQLNWQFNPEWSANFGLRHSRIAFDSRDHYIVTGNPDDSGRIRYSATLPVFGLMFATSESLHFYATAGRGFETPTLNELAYSPSGQTGLNLNLQAARSRNLEVGSKLRLAPATRINAALFAVNTSNEIVTLSNLGGRSTFTNASNTRRRGFELAYEQDLARHWRVQIAYTLLDAIYSSAFKTCVATPCATPTTDISAGRRIPGVARNNLYGELVWEPQSEQGAGWRAAVEARSVSRINVNDLNTDAAPTYAIANLRLGYVTAWAGWQLNTYARIDNLFDQRYAGSVIVNEGNGRFFEPAQGRNGLLGMNATRSF